MPFGWKVRCVHSSHYKIYHNGEWVCGICINYKAQALAEMVYKCVSLSDVMRENLSEELYNEVTGYYETQSNE